MVREAENEEGGKGRGCQDQIYILTRLDMQFILSEKSGETNLLVFALPNILEVERQESKSWLLHDTFSTE